MLLVFHYWLLVWYTKYIFKTKNSRFLKNVKYKNRFECIFTLTDEYFKYSLKAVLLCCFIRNPYLGIYGKRVNLVGTIKPNQGSNVEIYPVGPPENKTLPSQAKFLPVYLFHTLYMEGRSSKKSWSHQSVFYSVNYIK